MDLSRDAATGIETYRAHFTGHAYAARRAASFCGADRFQLSRAFSAAYGLPPHAWLVQLRLTAARRRLAAGEAPADVAAAVGFADQSHLGRWFRRAFGLTPAAYRAMCTNVPDGRSSSR